MELQETIAYVGAGLTSVLFGWFMLAAAGPFRGWEWLFGLPLSVAPAVLGLYLGLRPFVHHLDEPAEPTDDVPPTDRRRYDA